MCTTTTTQATTTSATAGGDSSSSALTDRPVLLLLPVRVSGPCSSSSTGSQLLLPIVQQVVFHLFGDDAHGGTASGDASAVPLEIDSPRA